MALRKRHRESEVSTDSLSDIMFFLLLFFLILSTMVSPNAIQVNLPSSDNTTPPPQNKVIHLGINEKRMCFVEQTPTEFGNLENVLKTTLLKNEGATVVLHIDRTLQYQDFIDVLQIGNKLKCKMVCATQPSNS